MKFMLLPLFLFFSCSKDSPAPRHAVYHWESTYQLFPKEEQWLERHAIERIYLRLFDIDWDESLGQPIPVGPLQVSDSLPLTERELVPVFFLTNRSFAQLPESGIDTLVARMIRKTKTKLRADLGAPLVKEWQFDCDWTEETRERYFQFLQAMDRELKKEGIVLSATIRLHQVKYHQKTGVPPVDRGMLMFYNMSDVADPETSNSILDLGAAKNYYYNFDSYPLPLDLALPLFRWGVVFREGKMVRLINGLGPEALRDESRFVFRDSAHVELQKSTYLDGYYLYEGDEIRLEWVSVAMLRSAVRDLNRAMPRQPEWVCFYHLAPETIKQFADDDLEAIWNDLDR